MIASHYHYRYIPRATYIRAYLFSVAILGFLIACLAVSYFSADPLILGSELNGNGTMEYLCLGKDCELLWVN